MTQWRGNKRQAMSSRNVGQNPEMKIFKSKIQNIPINLIKIAINHKIELFIYID